MVYGKVIGQYTRSNIETAGNLDLIITCYENAILCLTQAKNHIKENELEEKSHKTQKALDIINALQGCLNFEKGGQIARNLDAIYTYLNKRILLGDIQKNLTALDESIRIMNELKSAWDSIAVGNEEHRISVTETPKVTYGDTARIAA